MRGRVQGNFVRAPSVSPVGFARVETLSDIQRCYEFRLNIETTSAILAAERHNSSILSEMEDALDMMPYGNGQPSTPRRCRTLPFISLSQRLLIITILKPPCGLCENIIYVGMQMHGQSLLNEGGKALIHVFDEHNEIYRAIKNHDSKLASSLMQGAP